MLAQICSLAIDGLHAHPVTVEVSISAGLPAMSIGGLADTAILEARERVRTALKESGMAFPMRRITCNLTPAHVRKEGSHYDLAIALGILIAQGEIPTLPPSLICIGELSLSGDIRPVRGILSMAIATAKARSVLFCPKDQLRELESFSGFQIIPCSSLSEIVSWIKSQTLMDHVIVTNTSPMPTEIPQSPVLLEDIQGMEFAKAAIVLAIAGGHHVLMIGSPGIGKTLIGQAAKGLQTALCAEERIEVACLQAQLRGGGYQITDGESCPLARPFRSPHHSISSIAMIGGGNPIRPGEISLSHLGILFLDELPEFHRDVIEALRQPMQDGTIGIVRASGSIVYPARATVIAAMNPCRCGYFGSAIRPCSCQQSSLRMYWRRLSGPILDRFDMVIDLSVDHHLPDLWIQRFSPWTTDRGRSLVSRVRAFYAPSVELPISTTALSLVERYRERGWVTRRSAKSLISMATSLARMFSVPEIDEELVRMAFQFKGGVRGETKTPPW